MERSNTQTRELLFDVAERSADSEVIPVVVSSDDVVDVADGPEILVHSADAVDLRRAPLPIIATHRGNQINVGLVENIRLVQGRMRGDARFGERQEAAEYKRDVLNRIIRAVSVGYARLNGTLRKDGVLVTTKWMPTHVAMVAEPADVNAGFFRESSSLPNFQLSEEDNALSQREAVSQPAAASAAVTMEDTTMSEQQATAAGAQAANVQVVDGFNPARAEAQRIETIRKIASTNDITDERQIQHWVRSGKDFDQIADDIIAIRAERTKAAPSVLGLTPRETSRFSIVRAINAACTKDWSKAGFEAEVSRAAAQRMGRSLGEHSFLIPVEVMHREMIVGTAAQGGNLVGTDNQPASFIELLRNRSIAMRLGARTLSGLQGNVTIPTQAAAGNVGWVGESGTATESNATFGQKTMSPKTVAGYQQYSRQLFLQSSLDVESLIAADLAAQVALAVDTAVLTGTSTNSTQPLGIRYTSGLGTANVSGTSGAQYGHLIAFQSAVASSNALFDNFAYVTHPAVAAILMGKSRFTNSDTPIWNGALLDGQVVGKRAMASMQVTSGHIYGGDFTQVVIGEWGPAPVEIEVNPYANFQAGITGVRAMYSCDVLVRYGSAFALGTGYTS